MVKKVLVLLAALLAASYAFAPPAAAYEPNEGGIFNVPRPWGGASKFRIVEHVERAIRETPRQSASEPNPIILITGFLFERTEAEDALVAACKRGVSVRVILNEEISTKPSERLVKALNGDDIKDADGDGTRDPGEDPNTGPCGAPLADREDTDPLTDTEAQRSLAAATDDPFTWGGDRSYVRKCNGSCRGAGGNMHSKIYAFSQTGDASNVVMVSSSNLNHGGTSLGWNDLYTMRGVGDNAAAQAAQNFEIYLRLHREMTDEKKADNIRDEYQVGPYTHRFFPIRDAGKNNDPTLDDLNKIGCRSSFGRTLVNVSQFYWAKDRGVYLANKLIDLGKAGCDVNIIHAAAGGSVIGRLRDAARRKQIELWDSRWDFNRDGDKEIRAHTKYVLVKGKFGADSSAHLVSTGTQNWVDGSLSRGDENTVNIELASAWNDYIDNWRNIARHSRKFPKRS